MLPLIAIAAAGGGAYWYQQNHPEAFDAAVQKAKSMIPFIGKKKPEPTIADMMNQLNPTTGMPQLPPTTPASAQAPTTPAAPPPPPTTTASLNIAANLIKAATGINRPTVFYSNLPKFQ
jgi:hypothetical protein